MTSVSPALETDLLPMVRNSSGTYSNNKITIQEVIDLVPGGAASVLTESATSEKISAMPGATTAELTDIIPIVRSESGVPTNESLTLQKIVDIVPGGAASLLVETGSSSKISALADGTSFNANDKIVIARAGQNYALTQQEVLAAIPAGEPGILMESGSAEKISAMTAAGSAQGTDLLPISRVVSGSPANRNVTVQEILDLAPSSVALSPYQGCLDASGAVTAHYVNLTTPTTGAYANGKTILYTIANITETNDLTMESTDQIMIQVGQGFVWDLNSRTITAAAGNDFGIMLTDGSGTFRYARTTGTSPFASFGATSCINIIGNAGIIQNQSTVDDSYIDPGSGILLSANHRYLLPNASGGGYKTNSYTNLTNIIFTGGGTSCQKAFYANGGSVSNIIFTGSASSWLSGGFLNDSGDNYTLYDNIYYDVNLPMSFNLNGSISNLLRNPANTSSSLTVSCANDSTIKSSTIDALVLASGTTGVKSFCGSYLTVSYASDNSTTIQHIGDTFINNVVVYGNVKFTNCEFLGGVTVETGATAYFTGCSSSASLVNSGTVVRAGNNSNIGNDY